MVYADDFIIMGESVYIIKKTPTALVNAGKKIVPKVNVDKTKYMVMSLDNNAGRIQYVKSDDSSFERVFEF
jgi:hypothetical protein